MNFLLHRHLGARDLGSAAAGFGAMLPDTWRMADRRVRPSREALASREAGEGALAEVVAGVAHHLAADEWFHHESVFVVGEHETTDRLRHAKLTSRHASMFAHVMWELCLDGALVRREGGKKVLAELRGGVDAAGTAGTTAAEQLHFSRVVRSPEERSVFEERHARICVELLRGPWILGYATGEGIAARISGVRQRLGLLPMSESDVAALGDVASSLEGRAEEALETILATPTFAADGGA